MLLVGGGTGLAPLKSILRHVIENGLRRDMTLYWGVRAENWATRPNYRYQRISFHFDGERTPSCAHQTTETFLGIGAYF